MYVLVPAEGYSWACVYGVFNSYDAAEEFAVKNGLVASHRPRTIHGTV